MITILAIIGLIFLLWWASKALSRLGNTLTRIGEDLIDYSSELKRIRSYKVKSNDSEKTKETIKTIKDEKFTKQVRDEIEQLTDPEAYNE